jgi:hypothetical protein
MRKGGVAPKIHKCELSPKNRGRTAPQSARGVVKNDVLANYVTGRLHAWEVAYLRHDHREREGLRRDGPIK